MSKLKGDPGYRDGWCIHYRPPSGMGEGSRVTDNTCEAGVSFDTLARPWPCFLAKGKPKEGNTPCDKLRLPTPEEIVAHEGWARERMAKLALGMAAVLPYREQARKTKRGVGGEIACPACENGMLRFSIAASNGHCHAHCSTDGCLSWME